MYYSVELYFDRATAERIMALISVLKKECGGLEESTRPHISLAVFDCPDEMRLKERVKAFAKREIKLSFPLSSLGVFPTAENVLFLAPKVTKQMLGLHEDFLTEAKDLRDKLSPLYNGENWVPHITLATCSKGELLQKAFKLAAKAFKPFPYAAVKSIGICAFPPARTVFETEL